MRSRPRCQLSPTRNEAIATSRDPWLWRRCTSPFYDPFWAYTFWGYPGFYPPAFYSAAFVAESSARIQVTPREAEVYVDGYRAGIVDDFDGFAQRLRVPPGEHVIELYLEGYKPVTQNILFTPGETFRIRYEMEKLASGEAQPPRPTPRVPPATSTHPPPYDAFGRPAGASPATAAMEGAGVLVIRVQPGDAAVIVDGERWQGSGDRLEIQVTPGPHRIEVQKDGYQPFTSTVQSRPGEATVVNVSLTRSGEI